MAERRMFAKTITRSDAFLDMPNSSQNLYFHLNQEADDEGFVNSPKGVMRIVNCNDDDLKILIAKKFIIPFQSGVIVIKHWRIHNYIRGDRLHETKYKSEKAMLELDDNQSYRLTDECQADASQLTDKCHTEVRLGKVREGKDRLGKVNKKIYGDLPTELHEPIEGFIEMRKSIKSPITDRALKMVLTRLNELSGGDTQLSIAILNQSTMNSWKSIYPITKKVEKGVSFLDL